MSYQHHHQHQHPTQRQQPQQHSSGPWASGGAHGHGPDVPTAAGVGRGQGGGTSVAHQGHVPRLITGMPPLSMSHTHLAHAGPHPHGSASNTLSAIPSAPRVSPHPLSPSSPTSAYSSSRPETPISSAAVAAAARPQSPAASERLEQFRSRAANNRIFESSVADLYYAHSHSHSQLPLPPSAAAAAPLLADQLSTTQQQLQPMLPATLRERSPSPGPHALLHHQQSSTADGITTPSTPFAVAPPPMLSTGSNVAIYSSSPSPDNEDHEGSDESDDRDKLIGSGRTPNKNGGGLLAKFMVNPRRNVCYLIIGLVCVVLTVSAWNASVESTSPMPNNPKPLEPTPPSPPPTRPPNLKPVLLDDIFTGALYPARSTISWLPPSDKDAPDGDYVRVDYTANTIVVSHVNDNPATSRPTVLVDGNKIKAPDGKPVVLGEDFSISADRQFVLIPTKKEKHWRHSYTADYVVYNVAKQTFAPLTTTSSRPTSVQVARWAPTGHNLAFVRDNDVYAVVNWVESRLTFDGSAAIMNGVPDWVYEEEVLATSHALFWSASGQRLAWLRFNDTSVPVYSYPYYFDPQQRRDAAYPSHVPIRYPKPGYANPGVSVHVHDVLAPPAVADRKLSKASPVPAVKLPDGLNLSGPGVGGNATRELLITDVTWVGETMVLKVMNRIQNKVAVVAVDPPDNTAVLVRELAVNSGWIEIAHQAKPLQLGDSGQYGYLDLIDVDGYTHLALFRTARVKDPIVLTRGPWEVVAIKGVDMDLEHVYVLTTQQDSTLRTLARVRLDGEDPDAKDGKPPLVDDKLPPGFYSVSFSAKGKYYWVSHDGPGVPWQAVRKPGDAGFDKVLESNGNLRRALVTYAMPKTEYTQIPVPVDGKPGSPTVDLNAVVYYPPEFDPARKYPVFMRVYGGPNSQLVQQKYDADLHTYLASNKSIVCVVVDGRGTGFRGRQFRTSVYRNLGELESQDQVQAAKWLARTHSWVDARRMGIWGWSYGGYVTSKVVERNTEGVFAFGISVAPVTDWRFYDSVYTERYMSTPADNPTGYRKSTVANMAGFKRTRFLLVHGSGDDNVHVQQSMALVRKLQMAQVHAYRLQVFPDSDHSMNFGNAYRELYAMIDRFVCHVVFGTDEYEVLAPAAGKLRKRQMSSTGGVAWSGHSGVKMELDLI